MCDAYRDSDADPGADCDCDHCAHPDPLGDAIGHAVADAITDAYLESIANGYTVTIPNGRTVRITDPNGYRAGYILSDLDDPTADTAY